LSEDKSGLFLIWRIAMAKQSSHRKLLAPVFVSFVLGLLLIFAATCRRPAADGTASFRALAVDVQVDKGRPKPGETVAVSVVIRSAKSLRGLKVSGSLFVPTRGARALELRPAGEPGKNSATSEARYEGFISMSPDSPEGLYALTVEAARGGAKGYGKASFLLGKVVADFMPVSALPNENLEQDIRSYYEDFRKVGGNLVIIHNFITDKALYPSRICSKAAAAGSPDDKVTLALRLAEEFGLTAFLTAGWDMTRPMPYSKCLASTKEIIGELWDIYGASPALLGFYSYQEGSGTYLAAQMREFTAAVKSHNRGLLTGCAPYIDDPLLAGYLASIDDLDIVIYQGAVMASYRPDNRKCFPPRRTKDFTSLSAGATRARHKITISHVELFGYMEKQVAGVYLASPEDIRSQILSAATAFGPDGISFFNYYYCIHLLGKKVPEVEPSNQAVVEAMKAYGLIAKSAAASSSRVGVYVPYSDWWVDRWTNIIVPALDAFRRLGVSPDILPFVPPPGEEILPYYPLHLNPEQLAFFQANNYALVLTDIGGFQDTDGFLIKRFIEDGGRVVFFGSRIPYTRTYARDEACGGRENAAKSHAAIRIVRALGDRVKAGASFRFAALESPSWTPTSGQAVATFEDGSAAVLMNRFGKGTCFTIPLTITDAVRVMPELVRDVLDKALGIGSAVTAGELGQRGEGASSIASAEPAVQTAAAPTTTRNSARRFDIVGLDEDSDVAMSAAGDRRIVSVVNYKRKPVEIGLRPLAVDPSTVYGLTDLRTGAVIRTGPARDLTHTKLTIPAVDFICVAVAQEK
jgi:hypothetical protein